MSRLWICACLGLLLSGSLADAQLVPPPDDDYDYPGAGVPYAGNSQAMVASWYTRYLRRPADFGAGGWVNALDQGQAPARVLSGILGSVEYYRKAGGTPPAYITALYQDLTGSPPLPQQLQYWLRQMRFTSRRNVAYQLLLFYSQSWQGAQQAPLYSYRPPVRYPHHYPYYSNYP